MMITGIRQYFAYGMKKGLVSGRLAGASALVFASWVLGTTKPAYLDDAFGYFIVAQGTTVSTYLVLAFAALAGVLSFHEDHLYHFDRDLIRRFGLFPYVTGTLLSVLLLSALAGFLGTFLFWNYLLLKMKPFSEESLQMFTGSSLFGDLTENNYYAVAAAQCAIDGCMAGIIGCAAGAFGAALRNRFTICCIPMLIYWVELSLCFYVWNCPAFFDWNAIMNIFVGRIRSGHELLWILAGNILLIVSASTALAMPAVRRAVRDA